MTIWEYERVHTSKDVDAVLAEYGRAGWELVHYEKFEITYYMVFKRPKEQQP